MAILKKIIFIILLTTVFLSGFYFLSEKIERDNLAKETTFGVTFSRKKIEALNLDWREVYQAILDDLKVKKIRLSAYWDEIEKKAGEYDFRVLDWQVEKAERKNIEIILAVGQKLPGWPECHLPDWVKNLKKEQRESRLLIFLGKVIERYKGKQMIKAWQLENEPFLTWFGLCPSFDEKFFAQEVDFVRRLDQRPIIVSESGELSTWLPASRYADILGVTMYRVVWNKYFKYFTYPYPASLYFLKGEAIKKLTKIKKIICLELQAEPWSDRPLLLTPLAEQKKIMNLDKFKKIIEFAKRAGFSEYYFWGVEWWYWLKEQGDSSFWNEARLLWQP
ncbi:MAG: beta-galactosidase [Patescibacteria group bacterium]|nr:beta-galactosidase [Patescibacteria group bacterium]